jgi:hypothetical protein
MESETSPLYRSVNAFDERNDFLHLLLGMVSLSRTVAELLGSNPDTGDPAAEAPAASAPRRPRDLLR